MSEEIVLDAEERMESSIAHLKENLNGIRTGRANPGLVDSLNVNVASYGGSDGTAYTIFHEADDYIYGFGKRWDRHIDDCLQDIAFWQQTYRAGSIACEKNADKGYLARDLEGMGFYVDSYTESMNKFVKISTYLRKNWHRIRWLPDTDPEYIAEILDYTEFAEHDDAPDSAASLLRKIENKLEYNPIQGGI